MISDLVKEAAAAGLDPAAAWWRTPGELLEVIEAYRTRMERKAYMLYNQASLQIMSDEEILAAAEAWASLGEHSELPD